MSLDPTILAAIEQIELTAQRKGYQFAIRKLRERGLSEAAQFLSEVAKPKEEA